MKHPKQSNQGSAIDAALAKIGASPLVGLAEEIPHIHMDNSCPMSKDDWGYVTSTGHIFLNPRKDGTMGEWTYVLAHPAEQLVSYLYVRFRQEVYPALLSYNSEQYNYAAHAKP